MTALPAQRPVEVLCRLAPQAAHQMATCAMNNILTDEWQNR